MNPRTPSEATRWIGDDPFDNLGTDMDKDLVIDEFDAPDGERELDFDMQPSPKNFTARQRIEIAREERWLHLRVADFEDIDRIDSYGETYLCELSH